MALAVLLRQAVAGVFASEIGIVALLILRRASTVEVEIAV
jgi:hypothetical protein